MAIRVGTSHFISVSAAVRYYGKQGFGPEDVQRKMADREIHIGQPKLEPGERVEINDEGRYVIVEGK